MSDQFSAALTLSELRARRDDILRLTEEYGAFNVRIFGSVARDEATVGSDLDLVACFPPGITIFDLVGLWLDLQELLGYEVNLLDEAALEGRFRQNVERDAVPL